MSECKIEFDEQTGAVTVGPGELPAQAFNGLNKGVIRSIEFTGPVTAPQDCGWLFDSLSNLNDIKGLRNLDTSQVTNMNHMFSGCSSLTSLDLSSFDTSGVEDMSAMFLGCKLLFAFSVEGFETQQVTNMESMFSGCTLLTSLDVSHFDTSQVTNMRNMFRGCLELTSLDVSNWNTLRVTDMRHMFCGCDFLTNLDLSSFNTRRVEDMFHMFAACPAGEIWEPILQAGGLEASSYLMKQPPKLVPALEAALSAVKGQTLAEKAPISTFWLTQAPTKAAPVAAR